MSKDSVSFSVTQSPAHTQLLLAFTGRILGLWRIGVWLIFSVALTACILLGTGDENIRYAAPLAMLSALLCVGTLVLFCYAARLRPRLEQAVRANQGVLIRVHFGPDQWTLWRGTQSLKGNYRCLLGQYWCENAYIVHLRVLPAQGGQGDELLLIPLTEETFDDVYALAEALQGQKKPLRRLRLRSKK